MVALPAVFLLDFLFGLFILSVFAMLEYCLVNFAALTDRRIDACLASGLLEDENHDGMLDWDELSHCEAKIRIQKLEKARRLRGQLERAREQLIQEI